MNCNKQADVGHFHKVIKMIELLGVLLAVGASLYLSVAQQSADMNLLFGVFLGSSVLLTATTFILKNYNFLLMSSVYLLINLNGFIGSL